LTSFCVFSSLKLVIASSGKLAGIFSSSISSQKRLFLFNFSDFSGISLVDFGIAGVVGGD
jgi:hypothetical protein